MLTCGCCLFPKFPFQLVIEVEGCGRDTNGHGQYPADSTISAGASWADIERAAAQTRATLEAEAARQANEQAIAQAQKLAADNLAAAQHQAAIEAQAAATYAQQQREAQERQLILANEQAYGGGSGGSGGHGSSNWGHNSSPSLNYNEELFRLAAPAATQESSMPHPELAGATAANIHSSSALAPRHWASDENQKLPPEAIRQYHPNSPVVFYNTDIQNNGDMSRAHEEGNQAGTWSTNSRDIDSGHLDAQEIQRRLSLSYVPSYVSDVNLPVGTHVTASRPESGEARQYNYSLIGAFTSWFTGRRKIG